MQAVLSIHVYTSQNDIVETVIKFQMFYFY